MAQMQGIDILKISASNFCEWQQKNITISKHTLQAYDKVMILGVHLVCQWFKDPPEKLPGQVQFLLWGHSKVCPAIWEAVIFPATLIVVGQKLQESKP